MRTLTCNNNMSKARTLLALSALLLPATTPAIDPSGDTLAHAHECPDRGEETPLASEVGSAGFMHNLAYHPKSIRAIAQRLLEDALNGNHEEARDCAPGCDGAERSEIVYRVSPTDFLAQEDQRAVCLRFETETKGNPMRFESKAFDTIDAVNNWIMDFAQGLGEDGARLYEQCSSNCSPRYTFLIAEGIRIMK